MPQKDEKVHIRLSKREKDLWREHFEKEGHSISSGIRATINKIVRETLFNSYEGHNGSKEALEQVAILNDKLLFLTDEIEKLKTIEPNFPEPVAIDNLDSLKIQVREKLMEYGPMSTLSLADLLEIPGPQMLSIMKKIKEGPGDVFVMNENFEWCIKQSE
jgi:hypothetical protein